MSWRNLIGYWSMLGLATKSSQWEQSMNEHLLLMTRASTKASALAASSTEKEELVIDNSEKAAADQVEAAELEEEAVALMAKSKSDFALAAASETELDEMKAKIALEEEEGAAHVAAAAAEELVFESEMAEATTDSATAFELEAEAHGEEIGITVCEAVPFLDVICGVVGGVTAVGLEVSASAEAAKASTEFAAAAAAKAEEDREIALEAEIQAGVAEDGAVASGLRDEEVQLEKQAEAEQAQAEEKQTASQALFAQAQVEEDASAQFEAEALEEQESAAEQTGEALSHGVQSCWNAIMAGACGALALLFFSFRLTTSYVIPALVKFGAFVTGTPPTESAAPILSLKAASYFIQHCLIFFLVAGMFSRILPGLEQNTLKARGGIIILFGCTASSIQTISLHIVPDVYLREQALYQITFRTISRLLVFGCIFILELLILWVTFGRPMLQGATFQLFGSLWFEISCAIVVICHVMILELQIVRRDRPMNCWYGGAEKVSENNCRCADRNSPRESDALLPTSGHCSELKALDGSSSNLPPSLWDLIKRDFGLLLLPFEILVLACMVSLLGHCFPSVLRLWPESKKLLLAARPDWLVPLFLTATLFTIALLAYEATKRIKVFESSR